MVKSSIGKVELNKGKVKSIIGKIKSNIGKVKSTKVMFYIGKVNIS